MTPSHDPLRDTLSFWLCLAGVGLGLAGRRRAGGTLLLLAAYGYAGIIHERIAGARISGYRRGAYKHLNLEQFLWHLAAAIYGKELLTR